MSDKKPLTPLLDELPMLMRRFEMPPERPANDDWSSWGRAATKTGWRRRSSTLSPCGGGS